jgi:hypothetical protein
MQAQNPGRASLLGTKRDFLGPYERRWRLTPIVPPPARSLATGYRCRSREVAERNAPIGNASCAATGLVSTATRRYN